MPSLYACLHLHHYHEAFGLKPFEAVSTLLLFSSQGMYILLSEQPADSSQHAVFLGIVWMVFRRDFKECWERSSV